jgi:hypothetical protein
MTTDWCCRCQRFRDPEDFLPLQPEFSYCRSCRSEIAKEWRERNPEAVAAYNEARRLDPRKRKCIECSIVFLAGRRGPAATRCINCRRARKLEQRRELRRKVAVT